MQFKKLPNRREFCRLEKIEILGAPIEIVKERFSSAMKTLKVKK
jgi:hypothetical protein